MEDDDESGAGEGPDPAEELCVVTGASGYLGRTLCSLLADQGVKVLGVGRREVATHGCSDFICHDLAQEAVLTLPTGVTAVYHLAATAHTYANSAQYRKVNVNGALRVANAAARAGADRLIYVSSVKASRAQNPTYAADGPADSLDYGASKRLAEEELLTLCARHAMRLVIVRPALMYSSQPPGHLALLRRWCRLRLPAPPDVGGRSMVSREDVARLLTKLRNADNTPRTPITITDGKKYSAARVHAAFNQGANRRPLFGTPSIATWLLLARAYERMRRVPAGSMVERLFGEELYTQSGLDDLGFSPELTLELALGQARGQARGIVD
ncbi:MAG: NAD-dependent epimerase/dehydratase family protein [Pseudomonadota bacterium]